MIYILFRNCVLGKRVSKIDISGEVCVIYSVGRFLVVSFFLFYYRRVFVIEVRYLAGVLCFRIRFWVGVWFRGALLLSFRSIFLGSL